MIRTPVAAAILSMTAACSTTHPIVTQKRPMVASMQPMAPAPVAVEEEVDDSVSAHLERAFRAFRHEEFKNSSESFVSAIATQNLNDSGRALAYWHLYLCGAHLGDEDAAAEALTSFIVVATDMLDEADRYSFERMSSHDFIERFDLPGRLARARATLAAMWVGRSDVYGRSDGQPIRVNSAAELDAFLELAPPCSEATQRQIDRKVIATDGETTVEEIMLYCDTRVDGTRYIVEQASRSP